MIGKLYFTTHLISVQPQLDPQTSRLGIQLQYFILIMSEPQKTHVKISFSRLTFRIKFFKYFEEFQNSLVYFSSELH